MNSSPRPLGLQPPLAWTTILGFAVITALGTLAGMGKIMNLVFPVGALAVGLLLYCRYPILYLGFTWWMWFLSPLVRRLADYRSGYTDPSPILLTPYLVTLVTLVTLYQNLPKTYRQGDFPFIFSLLGVLYGFFVGIIYRSPITVGVALLDWLAPVLLGFHLFVNWRNYPSYRNNIQRTFLWGVLVMGIYGIIQFWIVPDWDRFWLIQSGFNTGGKPEPFQVYVWSTLNSNRPFGTVMMAGLLLLFINKNQGALGVLTKGSGYLAFLLTRKRTTWGSWLLGVIILMSSMKAKTQMRIISAIIVAVLIVIPLATIEPFSDSINSRFESFSNLEDDTSSQQRKKTYTVLLNQALTSFFGEGIGGPSHDSAVLSTLFNLGWLGTIFYMGGLLLLILNLFRSSENSIDPFAGATRAITLSTFAQLPFGVPMLEVQGIILWGFLGISIAANKYYQNQRLISKVLSITSETHKN